MLRGLLLLAVALQLACAAAAPALRPAEPAGASPHGPGSDPGEWADPPPALGAAIARRAAGWVALKSLSKLSRRVPDDCTGLVRLAYGAEGIDLFATGGVKGDNGVSAIYRGAKRAGAVHGGAPREGDLVFFRETYDRNRDGVRNDGLTHVGIVESVDGSGTVTFLHRNGAGVSRSRFNPRFPLAREDAKGAVLNDYLRQSSKRTRAYLAGELFSGYAGPERLR
ncbi:MAG: CHAP domain-containing protein [Myxococcaceae bacterium]